MAVKKITETVTYIGTDDRNIDLFEGQYAVPNGIAYNSYLITDEKTVIMDTADKRVSREWLANLEEALAGKEPDYLVVSHMEPDHAASIQQALEKYPQMKIVGNAKTFQIYSQFFTLDIQNRRITVKEGDTLNIGKTSLTFIMAPMVHWPEVMLTYDSENKILFSADAFGKFGALDSDEEWLCEARRYYFNIVGKYGAQVQTVLKKVSNLSINVICPLHGPVLTENLDYYIGKYDVWSRYEPEDSGIFIAYASIYGNTAGAVELLNDMLAKKGADKVTVTDLARCDMAEALEDAFRYDRIVLAASSYDGGVFPFMQDFLSHLKAKNYQNRTVGLIENGSWAPSAAKTMKAALEEMKNISVLSPVVTIRSSVKSEDIAELEALADALLK